MPLVQARCGVLMAATYRKLKTQAVFEGRARVKVMESVLVAYYASSSLLRRQVFAGYAFSVAVNIRGQVSCIYCDYSQLLPSIAAAITSRSQPESTRLSGESMLLNLLRRHLFMGLTASALSTAPAAKGAIRYRQLWVSADGVTHIDEHRMR